MKNKSYAIALSGMILVGFYAPALANAQNLTNRVSRIIFSKMEQQRETYHVHISLQWKKDITLGDLMWRNPRRPARKDQVVQSKRVFSDCLGVLTNEGTRVLFPAVCLQKDGYELESVELSFQNGSRVSKSAQEIISRGEISQTEVSLQTTQGLPSVEVGIVPQGKSLQEFFGDGMIAHLRTFFHGKNIFSCHVRRGLISSRPNLTIGEPLIYQGRVVALVKKEIDTYADGFGGVSESAFAIVR